ncbi:FKBP-type peptidyl-prolyl cis-trans isomerase [Lacibacter luteus]|uniref:Peptidyl-prolyl cis-trans isomerase n=1 Tax=Lacibacter luteus TaxID=2508719 RepID=A0A4Q1CEZ4_9BACT|nr:FKBP-type peptidyl-prolyl cis-trans isomerase [Lacibacter luteus]RXK58147.1 FKBP-type peptidyl-prolyl cis-trans isomerase [Lacibacter luteus]
MRIFSFVTVGLLAATVATAQSSKPAVKKPAAKTTTTKTAAKPAAPKPLLRNGIDSLSYAIGLNIGGNMQAQGIENLSYIALNKGIADAMKKNGTPLMDDNTANMTIQQKLQEYMAKKNGAVKEEGRKFLAENKKQAGVVELPSGVQYKIITQGTGPKPLLEDTIKFHYKGTRLDGFVFDESYKRGEPVIYPLNQLIEGWKQTVVLMPAGSKWQLFIPSDYGYGDRGAGGDIPGGATLVFELELLEVIPVKK